MGKTRWSLSIHERQSLFLNVFFKAGLFLLWEGVGGCVPNWTQWFHSVCRFARPSPHVAVSCFLSLGRAGGHGLGFCFLVQYAVHKSLALQNLTMASFLLLLFDGYFLALFFWFFIKTLWTTESCALRFFLVQLVKAFQYDFDVSYYTYSTQQTDR